MFQRLATLTVRWPRAVLAAGILIVGLSAYYAAGIGGSLSSANGFIVKGSESDRVATVLADTFGERAASGIILFHGQNGLTANTAEFRAEVDRLVAPLMAADAKVVTNDGSAPTATLVSRDQSSSYAVVTLPGSLTEQADRLETWRAQTSSSLVGIQLGGPAVAQKQSESRVESDLQQAELISFPILALLLLIMFRGVVAAALPLILGGLVIVGGLAITRVLAGWTSVDQYAVNIITILGLGLSVDYSLLMVSRFREELSALSNGGDVREAVRKTVLTAGRTIFFSGLTVIVSLLTLLVFPLEFLHSLGLGAAAAILMAVVAALTVLPALLHLLGPWINRWQIIRRAPRPADQLGAWGKLGRWVVAHPWWSIIGSVAVICAMAYPVTQTRFVTQNTNFLPAGSTSREVAETLTRDFNGQGTAINVVVHLGQSATSASGQQTLHQVRAQLIGIDGVDRVSEAKTADQTAAFTVTSRTTSDGIARSIVQDIRSLHPANATLDVGSEVAALNDTLDALYSHAPLAAAIIVVAMFVLLGLLVRSAVIPIQAIVINSFALLASMGVLVFLFQEGHIGPLTWLGPTMGMDPTLPVLILAISFGLSMDYGAFLYSRMREEYSRTPDTKTAIIASLNRTGGIITAAALLLVVVVGSFASSSSAYIEQVGVGLTMGILVDAFIVRLFLVPAVMQQFGRLNWLAPKWFDRWQIRHD